MIRKILTVVIIALCCVAGANAQEKAPKKNKEEMRKEFREFKMKFIAQEIELKDDQEKKFFELYGQMMKERSELFEQTRAMERKIKKADSVSDEEYAQMSKAITEAKEKDAAIEKKYDAQFATVLSSKQIYKLKAAEEKFRRKLDQMRNSRPKRGNHNKHNDK